MGHGSIHVEIRSMMFSKSTFDGLLLANELDDNLIRFQIIDELLSKDKWFYALDKELQGDNHLGANKNLVLF